MIRFSGSRLALPGLALIMSLGLNAQNEQDALMMKGNQWCTGPVFQYSAWDHYWEGTLKRENLNLGTVSTKALMIMGNYGLHDKVNLIYVLPHVQTRASAGNLAGFSGWQDLGLWLKAELLRKPLGKGTVRVLGLGGYSFPVSNYSVDLQPMSIGLGSRNASARLMLDYKRGPWFATGSMTYVVRSRVDLDRTAYYTDRMNYSTGVNMPDATQWNLRAGYRQGRWVAEAVADNWTTRGGHDITPNNMPFISNRMEATRLGVNVKWEDGIVKGLSLLGGGMQTVAGRNMGQSTAVYGGLLYLMDFNAARRKAAGRIPARFK